MTPLTPAPSARSSADRPRCWHWLGLGLLMALCVAASIVTEYRSAFLRRPMTDVQVYLRAAWAARAGEDLYEVTDDNRWHYHYPPLLALAAMPLADAPAGAERSGLLPFAVSVALWYWLSVVALCLGLHVLAAALDPQAGAGSQRWWALRLLPLLACLPPIAATLMRGQVNLFLLALLCFAGAAMLLRRSGKAGFWMAAAACLKVIPALLLIYPLWRRDWRALAGCVLGLVLGVVVLPMAWFGPSRTVTSYVEWYNVLARPALGAGEDHVRDQELIDLTATDSQSLVAMIHNPLYLERLTRPHQPDAPVRLAHWLGGLLLLVLTLAAAGTGSADEPRWRPLLFLGSLTLVMLILSPVCHLHYFCLAVPLVMALIKWQWDANGTTRLGLGLTLLLAGNFVVNFIAHLPGFDLNARPVPGRTLHAVAVAGRRCDPVANAIAALARCRPACYRQQGGGSFRDLGTGGRRSCAKRTPRPTWPELNAADCIAPGSWARFWPLSCWPAARPITPSRSRRIRNWTFADVSWP